MSKFNEDYMNAEFVKFISLEGIVDAHIYKLSTEEYYQVVDYDEGSLPIIALPDGDLFGLIEDEMHLIEFYDVTHVEEIDLDDEELVDIELKEVMNSLDSIGDIMKKHFEEEENMLNPKNKKAVPTFKGADKHELSEKEVKKISDGLDKLMLENAINTALENKDFSALEKLSEVLRQESN